MEAELKIPVANVFVNVNLRAYITKILGSSKEEIFQIDTYFQSPIIDFYQTDEAFRIRRIISNGKDEKIEVTYKGPKKGREMKIREEITTGILHHAEATRIFQRLGFSIVREVSKKRTNWRKQSITLSLDEVEGLENYIEIELMVSEDKTEIQNKKDKLVNFTKEIFPEWDGKEERKSYLELLIRKDLDLG